MTVRIENTEAAWMNECQFIKGITALGGLHWTFANDKARFVRYATRQRELAEAYGRAGAVAAIQHCLDNLTGDSR